MNDKKILFLSTQLPYPPKSGGTIKSWNYIKHLASKYALSLACFLKGEDISYKGEFIQQIALGQFYSEPIDKPRSVFNILKSFMNWPSLNIYRNYSATFKAEIAKIANGYDLLLIDHYEMFQYVPENYAGKVVLHTHNAEFMLWERMGELTKSNLIKKLILMWEAKRVKRYEQHIFSRSDLVYTTPSDVAIYKTHQFDTSRLALTYHLGNDQLLELPDLEFDQTEKVITFIGTLSWEPNIDGLIWFIKEVWSKILEKHPDCRLWILGKDPDSRISQAAKGDDRIEFKGFVKDLDQYLKKTRVYIAPLRFGSGMKVKVLEGLYRGVPTVTTHVGAEGLDLESEKEIFIIDDVNGYAKSCIRLLEDQSIWELLMHNSRKKAQEKYKWAPLFENMDMELEKLF